MRALRLIAPLFLNIPIFCVGVDASMTAEQSAKVKSFLRSYLQASYEAGDSATRYFATSADLSPAGGQIIVYFTDRHSCGTGGLYDPRTHSFRLILQGSHFNHNRLATYLRAKHEDQWLA